jgi:hypothetical protein
MASYNKGYVCVTLSLTVREEHKLRVFENRVLRRIFGPKRNDVTGGWTRLHNEDVRNLYSFKYNRNEYVTGDEIGGTCSMYGKDRNVYIIGSNARGKDPIKKSKM